ARALDRRGELLLPAAELLFPALPGGRLPDHAARLLRPRHPSDSALGLADDVPRDDTPLALSPGLSRAAHSRQGGAQHPQPGRVSRLQLPALSAGIGAVPHGLRHASSLWLPAPHDAPQLPAGERVHRLLAADQYLLEGLHGPDRVQSGGLSPEAPAAASGAGG